MPTILPHSLSSIPKLTDDNDEQHNEQYSDARQEQSPQKHLCREPKLLRGSHFNIHAGRLSWH